MDQINNLVGSNYTINPRIDAYEREIQTESIVQNSRIAAPTESSINARETIMKKKSSSFNFHPDEIIDEEWNEDGSDREVDSKDNNGENDINIMKNKSLPIKHQSEEKLKMDKKGSQNSTPNPAKFNFDGLEDMGEMMDSDLDGIF